MIVTLTANPSQDLTVTITERLVRGGVQRAKALTSQPGGKGVNISRAAVAAGIPSIAVLPAKQDDPYVIELLTAGVDCRPVTSPGQMRINLTLTEPDGTTTKINTPGPSLSPDVLTDLHDTLRHRALHAAWVVLAGSLPPGVPAGWYADLVTDLRGAGARVAVDTSDAPLQALVDRMPHSAPHLMKPNADELASLTGDDGAVLAADPGKAAAAARVLLERGAEAVLATLGSGGAVLVNAEGAWYADAPPVTVVSTVGAGDSSLFGYLLGQVRHQSPAECLALAAAYGSAAASLPGTTVPAPSQVRPSVVDVRSLSPLEP